MSRNDVDPSSEVPSRKLVLKGALAAGVLTAVPGAAGVAQAAADAAGPGGRYVNPRWSKSHTPVFTSNDTTKQYGPGHNSFTVAEDGRTDVLVHHARQYKDIVGDPLNDPDRHTRVQRLRWKPDGAPDFGIPVADTATAASVDSVKESA